MNQPPSDVKFSGSANVTIPVVADDQSGSACSPCRSIVEFPPPPSTMYEPLSPYTPTFAVASLSYGVDARDPTGVIRMFAAERP